MGGIERIGMVFKTLSFALLLWCEEFFLLTHLLSLWPEIPTKALRAWSAVMDWSILKQKLNKPLDDQAFS
jgi:hypothetical protein